MRTARVSVARFVVPLMILTLIQVVVFSIAGHASKAYASASTASGGLFVPAAGRVLNTQNGTGGYSSPMAAYTWRSIPIDGQAGVAASGVSAVAVNFSVVSPATTGYIFADKTGVATPNTSTTYMAYIAGASQSNSAVIPVGADGQIQVETSSIVDLIIDVQGYYTAGSTAAGGYTPVPATDIADTRNGTGGLTVGKIATGSTVTAQVTGAGGVLANASGVMLDITESDGTSSGGWLTPYPAGTTRPQTSLDWPASSNREWTVPVDLTTATSGKVTVYIGAGGPVNVWFTVEGYFTASNGADIPGQLTPAATRVYQTLSPSTPLAAAGVRTVQITGMNGLPVAGNGITAVAANITVIAPASGAGYIQAYADNTSARGATMQFPASATTSGMTIVPVGSDGGIDIQNNSGAAINFVVDIEGWYSSVSGAVPSGKTTTQQSITLQGTELATGGGNWVTYQYRAGSTGTFTNVPVADVTSPGTNNHPSAWPVAGNGSGSFDPYDWNLFPTFGLAPGLVQVIACFGAFSTDTNLDCTMPTNVTYVPTGISGGTATEDVGPGTLNMLNGDFEVSATDASTASTLGSLSLGRSLSTLAPVDALVAPGSQRTGPAGIFGPAWTSDLTGPDAGDGDLTVTDNSSSGYLVFTDPSGSTSIYQATTSVTGSKIMFTGVGDAAGDGETVQKDTTGTAPIITMSDPDGTVTTWTYQSSRWQVTGIQQPSKPGMEASTGTGYAYYTSGSLAGLVARVVAPAPSGVSCPAIATLSGNVADTTPGCRSLILNYGVVTVGGVNLIRLAQTVLSLPQTTGTTNFLAVQNYDYNTSGQLIDSYDPRISPSLKTSYTYDASYRLSSLTSPGEAAWTLSYNSAGQLVTISRPDPSTSPATTATTTVVYGVPFTGASAPVDLSLASTSTWDESSDLPVTATAVFDPDHIPAGTTPSTVSSSDWPYASIDYLDVNGREVNSAQYGASNWQIDTHQFDSNGNDVWDLTAGNRAQALTPTASTDPYVAAQASSAGRANLLASRTDYSNLNPSLITDTYGPTHPVKLDSGAMIDAETHVSTIYDQGAPNSDYNSVTHSAYNLPTQVTTDPFNAQTGADTTYPDQEITRYGYATIGTSDTDGWTVGAATTKTVQMGSTPSSSDLVSTTLYNGSGQVTEARLPADTAGTTAHTTLTIYYPSAACPATPAPTVGLPVASAAASAGLPCITMPAAQPTGTPIPQTTYLYDQWGNVILKTETSGTGLSMSTRSTTDTYDSASRITSESIAVAPVAAGGTPIPTVNYGYSTTTGRPTTTSTSAATLTTGYDSLGRIVNYTDASGNVATTGYDLDGQVVSRSDGKATTTYVYDSSSEHRGLVTSENIASPTQPSTFAATYDAAGNIATETYPNGLVASTGYDNEENPNVLSYSLAGSTWMTFTATRGDGDRIVAQNSPQSSQTLAYDQDDRLSTVADTYGGTCTTRVYAFDADSNRQSLSSYPASAGMCSTSTTPTTTTTSYDTADRDTAPTYSYDAFGRTLTVPTGDAVGIGAHSGSTGTMTIGYFSNDMVASQSQGSANLTFGIDPDLNRIVTTSDGSTITTNHYVNDTDSPTWSSTSGTQWTRNAIGPDGNLAASIDQSGTVTLELTNLHGDVVATAADSASDPSYATYSESTEYGAPRVAASAYTTYGWEGAKQRSSNALGGVTLMGDRLYNPATGRFLSVDSAVGGNANPYDYCTADPINCTDLNGEFGIHIHWKKLLKNPIFQGAVTLAACFNPVTCAAATYGFAAYNSISYCTKQGFGSKCVAHAGIEFAGNAVKFKSLKGLRDVDTRLYSKSGGRLLKGLGRAPVRLIAKKAARILVKNAVKIAAVSYTQNRAERYLD